jgi:hypothetical protein
MKKFVHYHNISTGVAFWSGEVDFDETKPVVDELNELLAHSRASLGSWSDAEQAGVFGIGPLPGLIVITDGPQPRRIDAFEASRLYEAAQRHRLPA